MRYHRKPIYFLQTPAFFLLNPATRNSVPLLFRTNAASGSAQPSNEGVCNTYFIKYCDVCDQIAPKYGISVAELESLNSQTWGWSGCKMLQRGSLVCVSSGQPPMPAALTGAVSGPRVPGKQRPSNWADLKSLNPCSRNECVSRSMTLDALSRLIILCSVPHMANAVLPHNIVRHLRLQVQHILRVNLSPPGKSHIL